ncbi:enoyl-CoA hydratase/isomerase family protein [Streptomyces xantholiticus]|uniref:Enoyl-CoA hydratase/isomerase family protein n=1 Tax=Streptomyces xantholiticus TaxID=68285 RepID=A0ABV1V3W9_9ACTN
MGRLTLRGKMTKKTVLVEQHDNVLVARLDSPPSALMTREMVMELGALVRRADGDPSVGAVVLTGTHSSRFLAHFDVRLIYGGAKRSPKFRASVIRVGLRVTGAALKAPGGSALLARSPLVGLMAWEQMKDVFHAIETSSAVWVAALNGDTGGGGCELALACDYRFMADGPYRISQPEIFLGFPPGSGGTQRLARLLGGRRALQISLEGTPISPAEAREMGLVDRVVAPDALLDAAIEHAAQLGRRPKAAIGAVKRAVREGGCLPLEEGLRFEGAEWLATTTTAESLEAQRAYLARTKELGDVAGLDPATLEEAMARGRFA